MAGTRIRRRGKPSRLTAFLDDARGAVMTEYVVVVGAVGIVTLATLLYCGVAVAHNFAFVRDYALYPFP